MKILHILHQYPEKYTSTFVAFAQAKLNVHEHVFVAADGSKSGESEGDPCTHVSGRQLMRILWSTDADAIVVHGFFYGVSTVFTWLPLLMPRVSRRLVWSVWGGDLYRYLEPRNPRRLLGYLLRKLALGRSSFVTACVDGDGQLARNVFCKSARICDAFYPMPLPAAACSAQECVARGALLLGNSGDETNNHIELFDIVERSNLDARIICPLAYGGTEAYRAKVVAEGRKRFGEQFHPLMRMTEPQAYASIINSVGAALFAHNRQQALGTILYLSSRRVPVFIKEHVTSYRFLRCQGIPVRKISDFQEYASRFPEMSEPPGEGALDRFDEASASGRWLSLFESVRLRDAV